MQDQHDTDNGRQPKNVRAASPLSRHFDAKNEMETLSLDNQRLLGEVVELTKILQRPQGARRIHVDQNTVPQEEQRHLRTPLEISEGGENSKTKEHDPYRPTNDGHDREAQGRNDEGDNPIPCQPKKGA